MRVDEAVAAALKVPKVAHAEAVTRETKLLLLTLDPRFIEDCYVDVKGLKQQVEEAARKAGVPDDVQIVLLIGLTALASDTLWVHGENGNG